MLHIDQLPSNSRVWIYQADRFLDEHELIQIKKSLELFIDQWSSHGQQMAASAEVYFERIVVIAADEVQAMASGCGIDKSVNFMKNLQSETGIDFFQRTQVLYKLSEKFEEAPLHLFWAMRKAGKLADETIVVDNTVKSLAELRSNWLVPFVKSWHAEMWLR